ncbi:type II toxin-antitoxin system Phd/YefM family antitoxin [Oleiharenicola lentus]|uniref:type II toxin-antitoxin system Phd/YefM family antitoxin n=1 Tax=Oleiharenicola lentus TaxID=2508720 RepID=UPI003F67A9DB
MKPNKPAIAYKQKEPETAQQIREAALAHGVRRDVVAVREAKDQLSALLHRASRGEQIVITSDGEPKAMIVRYRPIMRGKPWQSLKAFRDSMPMTPDSTPLIRADRDGGY